jgi:hypothetical protein
LVNIKAKEADHVVSFSFQSRWIGHADGSDRPNNEHFAKRSFHLEKLNPQSHFFTDEL